MSLTRRSLERSKGFGDEIERVGRDGRGQEKREVYLYLGNVEEIWRVNLRCWLSRGEIKLKSWRRKREDVGEVELEGD